MRKILLLIAAVFWQLASFACPVCDKQQPKILSGITHGAGPQSNWDYVIVWTTVLIVLYCLYYTIRYLVKPGESGENHIKRSILNFN